MRYIFPLILLLFLMNCTTAQKTYLALGDSYTIGESVAIQERWPVQLASKAENLKQSQIEVHIIATTGWTTDELLAALDTAAIDPSYDFVSLLIGVNNQYRGYPFEQFEKEYLDLLNFATQKAGSRDRVFAVTIPDYGVTPFGQTKDPSKIAAELDRYNDYIKKVCADRNIIIVDITPESRTALNDGSLVAEDGLHPSGKMYGEWVDLIWEQIHDWFD